MTARKSLEELLDLIFGANDLRRFLEQALGKPEAQAVGKEIQWEQIDSRDHTSKVVDARDLQGAVDEAFFDRLLAALPERAPEIQEVALRCVPGRAPKQAVRPRRAPGAATSAREGGIWDLFLAHAGPDGAAADQLYEVLVEEGIGVFLDSRCVRLGERWDDIIPAALAFYPLQ